MKVKDFLKKRRMAGNETVIVQNVRTQDLIELNRQQLKELEPEYIMNMTLNSFDIIDNVLTVYAGKLN